MGGGPVRGRGAVVVFPETPGMACHAFASVKKLKRVMRGMTPYHSVVPDERIEGAVEAIVDHDVIANVEFDLFTPRIFAGRGGQRFERRPLVELASQLLHVTHWPIVEFGEQRHDRLVQLIQVMERAVPQFRQDPQRCATRQAASTLALSRNFLTRTGLKQVPKCRASSR